MQKIAVAGLGCAGYHGIRALRENGYRGEIHVYTDTGHSAANPMLTTYYVAGKIPRDRMFPFGSLDQLRQEFDLVLHTDSRVRRIVAADKKILTEDGAEQCFDRILISTGARAVSPDLGQKDSGRSFLMRTVADADALKAMLEKDLVRKAVVIGASMVGIKVVELLADRGVETTLVDMADRLFPLACMEETARILEQDLQARGIPLILRTGVEHAEDTGQGVRIRLTDGQSLEADILVLCIGTRANTELVANTEVVRGEPVLVRRGIVADSHMQTNIPDIYAAGDCCEALNVQTGETMIIGLWANAAEQGRVAGCNMAGVESIYRGSIPNNITHYFDQTFIGIGDPNLPGERFCLSNRHGYIGAVTADGHLQCVNILGNYRISGMIREYLLHRIIGDAEPVTLSDRGLLRVSGIPDAFIDLLEGTDRSA